MRRVIAEAAVGDDVFGEDPTVNQFQDYLADLLGKEAALFVPSGTMGNEICINVLTRPGDEVICEQGCHIYNYESGAVPFLSGVQLRPLAGRGGVLTAGQVAEAIQPPFEHLPHTSVIAIENTHNSAGGTVFPLDEQKRLYELAQTHGLKLHLDGARIWNASVASGVDVREYARYCDTISVCFSKGLGAPVGSAIAGSGEFIRRARKIRKTFGGGMRQAGLLAAGAWYALRENFTRLDQDHRHAKALAQALSALPGITLDLDSVQTNIVIFDVHASGFSATEVLEKLKQQNILVVPFGPTTLRAVTHLNIDADAIDNTIAAFQHIFQA